MISKNRLGWLGRSFSTAAMAMALAAVMPACSDDGGEDPVVDAGPEECTGHACPGEDNPLTLPEAGLLRAELYHVGNDENGVRQEALGAWFFAFTNQDPLVRGVVGPPLELDGAVNVTCFDQTAHDLLVNGYSAENQTIADSRTYLELGPSLTLTSETGGTIEMARTVDGLDPTNQLEHDFVYLSELSAAAALERNASYSLPTLPPDDATGFPGLDLRNGFDIPGNAAYAVEARPPAIFMAPDFTMVNPVEDGDAGFYNPIGWQVDRTSDLTMEWAINDNQVIPADWPTAAQFTAFAALDDAGRPTIEYICIGPASAGSHTIPAALFDLPNFPETGLALHATFTHTAWENPGDVAHHFSYMAVNCNMGGYALVDPNAN